jgi:hypothetical protein
MPTRGCNRHLVSFTLYLQNETRRRVGLAADAAPEILPNYRRLPAQRLELAGREEGCQHLLENDGHHRQDADQHPAFDHSHRRVLAALGHHHAL